MTLAHWVQVKQIIYKKIAKHWQSFSGVRKFHHFLIGIWKSIYFDHRSQTFVGNFQPSHISQPALVCWGKFPPGTTRQANLAATKFTMAKWDSKQLKVCCIQTKPLLGKVFTFLKTAHFPFGSKGCTSLLLLIEHRPQGILYNKVSLF